MAKHVLLVLSNPTEGKEDEYNDWYDNTHLGEVLQIPGFTAAQRFEVNGPPVTGEATHKYMALYDLDTDNPQDALVELGARVQDGQVEMSDAIDGKTIVSSLFTPRGKPMKE